MDEKPESEESQQEKAEVRLRPVLQPTWLTALVVGAILMVLLGTWHTSYGRWSPDVLGWSILIWSEPSIASLWIGGPWNLGLFSLALGVLLFFFSAFVTLGGMDSLAVVERAFFLSIHWIPRTSRLDDYLVMGAAIALYAIVPMFVALTLRPRKP